MKHDKAVRWRGDLYNSWNHFGISRKDVDLFGDPWHIARAEQFFKSNEIEINWVGGDCENGSTLDIVLKVPSESGMFMSHDVMFKLERVYNPDQIGNILNPVKEAHGCKHTLYSRDVCRVPGKCKHEIAAREFIERNFGKIIEENAANLEDYDIYRIYTDSDTPYFVREKYDKRDMNLYKELTEEKSFDALVKRDVLYGYLKRKYS
ncbi:MAG: hypothetical protein KAT28_00425 [Candidatus Aenigmarchaeota archaeon]|nr:hypothetical protein [Candidatus Aenigmarchaeota archaeon]